MTILCVLRGPTVELHREAAGDKWCFRCRKRLPHDFVVMGDVEPSYYEPVPRFDCSRCHGDHTTFPGFERTWGEW